MFYTLVEANTPNLLSTVQARINFAVPVRYEDFLAAVTLICPLIYDYSIIFIYPNATSFFVINILERLRCDLKAKTVNYYGVHFDVDDFIDFYEVSGDALIESYQTPPHTGLPKTYPLPKSWNLLNICARTFMDIQEGNLYKAYNQLTATRIRPFGFATQPYPLNRPYYSYKDEERYRWFLFLQKELRRTGYADFADEILEVELDHYRELINWQLQARAYITKRLYEEKANDNFSKFKKLLIKEYEEIIKDDNNKENFQKSIDTLIDINKKSGKLCQTGKAISTFKLPWIDREDIDRRMGIVRSRRTPYDWE